MKAWEIALQSIPEHTPRGEMEELLADAVLRMAGEDAAIDAISDGIVCDALLSAIELLAADGERLVRLRRCLADQMADRDDA